MTLIWSSSSLPRTQVAESLIQRMHATSSGWTCVCKAPGFAAFCADSREGSSRAYVLDNQSAVIFGTVFERGFGREREADCRSPFSSLAAKRISESRGRDLVSNYWGRYVAFGVDRASGRTWVLRDPVGQLPCYYATDGGVLIVFSSLGDLRAIKVVPRCIDWNSVANHAIFGHICTNETALREVSVIRPGESITFGESGQSSQLFWDDAKFADCNPIVDLTDASIELRRVAESCVQAWASCYTHILLGLSGGLDSSIVLSCLHSHLRKKISCINFRAIDRDSDERSFARVAAGKYGIDLMEQERVSLVSLSRLFSLAPSPVPQFRVLGFLDTAPLLKKYARAIGATSIFDGEGGDELFCSGGNLFVVTDFIRTHGVNSRLFRVIRGAVAQSQQSMRESLRDALNFGVFRKTPDLYGIFAQSRALLTTDARSCARAPWAFRGMSEMLPGKFLQTLGVRLAFNQFYDPLGSPDDPEPVSPLYSQPVVEVCLRIPTYVHAMDGRDRAVARHAFADLVPTEIIDRQWKSDIGTHFHDTISSNIEFLRACLLDGSLVKERILDPHLLELGLADVASGGRRYLAEIFDHACLEAWLTQSAGAGSPLARHSTLVELKS